MFITKRKQFEEIIINDKIKIIITKIKEESVIVAIEAPKNSKIEVKK